VEEGEEEGKEEGMTGMEEDIIENKDEGGAEEAGEDDPSIASKSTVALTPKHNLVRLLREKGKLQQVLGDTSGAKVTLMELVDLVKELIEEEESEEYDVDWNGRGRIDTNESDLSELSDGDDDTEEEENNKNFRLKFAEIRHDLGTVARLEGDLETSVASLELSVALKTEIVGGHSRAVAESLSGLSLTMKMLGREVEAEELNRKAMRTFHDIDTNRVQPGWW
jgi:hypothetical protein